MSILDKLVERKDILIYIGLRIEMLKRDKKYVKDLPEETRQKAIVKLNGRIKELERMKQVIHEHKEKELSKKYWNEVNEILKSILCFSDCLYD